MSAGPLSRYIPDGERVVLRLKPSPLFILLAPLGAITAAVVVGAVVYAISTIAHSVSGQPLTRFVPDGAAVAVATGVLVLARLLWQVLEYIARLYILTETRVMRIGGVLRQRIVEAPVARIQHVVLYRSLRERLTGLRSIGFATAGTGGVDVIWYMVPMRLGGEDMLGAIRRVVDAGSGPSGSLAPRGSDAPAGASTEHGPLVIGLAGGVGAGKSAVAEALAGEGCLVTDSDKEAKAQLDHPEVREQLQKWWGDRIVDDGGRIDRGAVAEIVFGDPGERKRLEGLIHPRLKAGRRSLIERAAASGAPAIVIDAPLLFEAGVDAECDAVIFVDAPREQRLARVAETRGWSEAELDRREKAQMPLDEKRRRSNHVIENDGSRDALVRAVKRVLIEILGPRRAPARRTETSGPPSDRR